MNHLSQFIKMSSTNITNTINDISDKVDSVQEAVNVFWTLFGTVLVFWMHAGFTILEAGSIRSKNVQNIIFKNLIDLTATTIFWWLFGYAFAFGTDKSNGFIGGATYESYTISRLDPSQWAFWLFQWAFAATAITIISGAMAERMHMGCYLVIVFMFNLIVYPPVAHWVWSETGWLGNASKFLLLIFLNN